MSGLYGLIKDDMARFGNRYNMVNQSFQRNQTPAGETPRPAGTWHIDTLYYGEHNTLTYLVSNRGATEFYRGRAVLEPWGRRTDPMSSPRIILDRVSLDKDIQPVAAPDFAVVRMTPLTVHRSPRFAQETERTFLRIGVQGK